MNWWQYLLLVNIYLVLFYGFYALLLSRETFFQLNRLYLVSSALLSFFIPVIQADWVKNLFITQRVTQTLHGGTPVLIYRFTAAEDTSVSVGQVLAIVYLAGVILLALKLAWQLVRLNKIIRLPADNRPYSFFKKIKISDDNEAITAHENVHAAQWHSADVLLIEAVMIVNWFNPIVYFYRRAIKHIHEFIADKQAVTTTNKADYALLLLSQTFDTHPHNLVNNFFNHNLLKQRIMMLQKDRSARIKLLKYGLSAPLFMLMLVLSSATVKNSKVVRKINKTAVKAFEKPVESVVLSAPASTKPVPQQTNDTITTQTVKKNNATPDVRAQYPGGIGEFFNYLGRTLVYPAEDRDKNVQGIVFITFKVEKDGTVDSVRVLRGKTETMNASALKAVSGSPKWIPAQKNGTNIASDMQVPINFSLTPQTGLKPDSTKNIKGLRLNGENIKHPIYVVDGKVVADATSINSNNIESVDVRDDVANSGSKVVVITTKRGSNVGVAEDGFFSGHKVLPNGDTVKHAPLYTGQQPGAKQPGEAASEFFIKGVSSLKDGPQPIILVDGKERTYAELKAIPVDEINAVAVFKDDKTYKAKYGKRADNGVLVVTTKKK